MNAGLAPSRDATRHMAFAAALMFALVSPLAPAQPGRESLSSLDYIWGTAADALRSCGGLDEPWQEHCLRGADVLQVFVLACSGPAKHGIGCAQRVREAAELGDALKAVVAGVESRFAACRARGVPAAGCTELEHTESGLERLVARIAAVARDL